MANLKPAFITGSNAKIMIGDKTIAYATDLSYNISVATVPVEVIGRYEVVSNEPVAFMVEGGMSIIRYTARAFDAGVPDVAGTGNSLEEIVHTSGELPVAAHLDPARILASTTFDVVVQERYSDGTAIVTSNMIKFYQCRLTSRSSSLNKRGVLTESIRFVGTYSADFDADGVEIGGRSPSTGEDLDT